MPRRNHYFSSNLSTRGVGHDVLFWHGSKLVPPGTAPNPAQAAGLGRRQHNLHRRRRSGPRLGHRIRSRLESHLGLLRDDVDGVRILVVDLGVDVLLLVHSVLLAALHRLQTVSGLGKGLRIRHGSCTNIGRVARFFVDKLFMTVKLGRVTSWILKNIYISDD
jgi:hypothetical protein